MSSKTLTTPIDHVEQAAEIVAAYVRKNSLAAGEIAGLITAVHGALVGLSAAPLPETPSPPAVTPSRSITPTGLICLQDGKTFKSLKRHLSVHHNLTPEAYRRKWGLPADFPMVAPLYAKQRSQLAKSSGLGHHRRRQKNGTE